MPSEEGWNALIIRYALTRPLGIQRLPNGVPQQLADEFAVHIIYGEVMSASARATGERELRLPEISS